MSEILIQQAREHADVLGVVATEAVAVSNSVLETANRLEFGRAAGLIRETVPEIVSNFGLLASQIAAAYYDEARVAAGIPEDGYNARTIDQDYAKISEPIAGLAIKRVKEGVALEATQALIGGIIWSELYNTDRETVKFNANGDPQGTKYRRVTRPGACDFCLYMAAGFEGDGSNSEYKNYHSHCRCVDVPIFPGQRFDEPSYYDDFRIDLGLARNRIQEKRAIAREANPGMRDRDFFRKYPDLSITTKNLVKEVRKVKLGYPNEFTP